MNSRRFVTIGESSVEIANEAVVQRRAAKLMGGVAVILESLSILAVVEDQPLLATIVGFAALGAAGFAGANHMDATQRLRQENCPE